MGNLACTIIYWDVYETPVLRIDFTQLKTKRETKKKNNDWLWDDTISLLRSFSMGQDAKNQQ